MKHRLLILLSMVTYLTLGSGQTFAHHSFTSVYIHGKAVTIDGTVKDFLFRNPHSYVKVEAKDEKGEMQIWVIEWAAPTQLAEKGLSRTALRPGDRVIVTGMPGRVAEDHRMLLQKVERPLDGWKWEGTFQ